MSGTVRVLGVRTDSNSADMTVVLDDGREVNLRIVDGAAGEPVALVFVRGSADPVSAVGLDSGRVAAGYLSPLASSHPADRTRLVR